MSNVTQDFDAAIAQLKAGQAVAIPTETVYGLAALASNENAVKRVFALKNRPASHPLIIHVHPDFNINQLVKTVSPIAQTLMNRFWPGPLTLIFERESGKVLDCVTGGQSTVAIRCPSHPLTQAILAALGEPLVAPSANPFGKVSPTTSEHVQESFKDESLLILDGGRCELGIESTIVSVVNNNSATLLRPGAIDAATLNPLMGEAVETSTSLRAPGQLKQHYQPHKPITAFEDHQALIQAYQQKSKPIYVLSFQTHDAIDPHYFYHLPVTPQGVEFELYYQLRLADASHALEIFIELPPNQLSWAAVRDRILKASA